jgi:signal transduction histidine kinase
MNPRNASPPARTGSRFSNPWTHAATTVTILAGLWVHDPLQGIGSGAVFALTGAAYLTLGTWGMHHIERRGTKRGLVAYFAAMGALFVSLVLQSHGYAWIAGMPLLSQAVLFGSAWTTPIASIAFLAAVALPLLPMPVGELLSVLVGLSAAVAFVVMFSLIARRELEWRERAEALSALLQRANEQLRAHALEVAELAAMRERNRMAREVHDGLGHYLTAIHIQLEAARALMASRSERVDDALSRAQKLTHQGLEDVRQSVAMLRAPATPPRALTELLERLVEPDGLATPCVLFERVGEERPLSESVQHALLRVTQEALTNVRRHASAKHIWIELSFLADEVVLGIRDDGGGIPRPGAGSNGSGFGLIGMRERLQLLGGRLDFGNHDGGGFRVTAKVPMAGAVPMTGAAPA